MRPWLLIGLVTLLGLYQIGVITGTLQSSDIRPADAATALISAGWATLFLWSAVNLGRGWAARWRVWQFVLAFAAYSLLRLILFARADYDRQRVPFLLVLLVVFAILFVFVRWIGRDNRKGYKE